MDDKALYQTILGLVFPWSVVKVELEPDQEGLVDAIYHRVTNARAEGMSSRIQWIKYTARGFRNRDHFRTAIYFHLGGLDMTPEVLKAIELHTT